MMLPFCNQTMTIYRKEKDGVTRLVIRNGFFCHEEYQSESNLGKSRSRNFLLIVPEGKYVPQLEDRVMAGIGPDNVDWEHFCPSLVRGLGEVGYVTTTYFAGKVHHYEAGNR